MRYDPIVMILNELIAMNGWKADFGTESLTILSLMKMRNKRSFAYISFQFAVEYKRLRSDFKFTKEEIVEYIQGYFDEFLLKQIREKYKRNPISLVLQAMRLNFRFVTVFMAVLKTAMNDHCEIEGLVKELYQRSRTNYEKHQLQSMEKCANIFVMYASDPPKEEEQPVLRDETFEMR
jgi:hypothetical protein